MAGITTLTAGLNPIVASLVAKGAALGRGLNPLTGGGQVTWRDSSITSAKANNAVGGGDEAFCFLVTLAGGASSSVDLRSLTDLLGSAGVVLARLKWVAFRHLSAKDDPANAPAPNASTAKVGGTGANDWVSQANAGGPTAATWGVDLPPGGRLVIDMGPDSALGSAVDATHHLIALVNHDGVNAAVIEVSGGGGTS